MSAQAIAQYFAQVGILVDNKSIASVDSYLKRVENSLKKFQTGLEKSTRFNIRFNLDRGKITRAIQRTLNSVSKSRDVKLNLSKINIKTQNIVNKINRDFKDLTREGRGIKLDARLSQRSLVAMRRQLQDYMQRVAINPRVTATLSHNISNRVAREVARSNFVRSGGRGGGGVIGSTGRSDSTGGRGTTSRGDSERKARRYRNPNHNPMMIGGSVGAFMRYGTYALPLYAGAVGINAMANRIQELQSQNLGLMVATETVQGAGGKDAQHYQKYLSGLGRELGLKTQDITPLFAQMLSGSRGTPLEDHLEKGFAELLRFTTVMGIDDQSTKLTIKAFSQMIL